MSNVQTRPLAVVLLGPPGAGKGTHAGPLAEQLGLPHISTGDILREHIRNKTELGLMAKTRMDAGLFISDESVLKMLFERIGREDCKKGYILDGFPRTLPQAEALDAYFGDEVDIRALYFSVPDNILTERIVGRLTCKQCGRPYHVHFDPPKTLNTCDECHLPLVQREDDKEDVVRKRLEVYHTQTQPVIDYFAKKESFRTISGLGAKEAIFKELLNLF